MVAFLMHMEHIYEVLGQDARVLEQMQLYISTYLPGLFFYAQADLQRRFLNSLGITAMPLFTQLLSIGLHGTWLYLFTQTYDYGIMGIGLAGCLTNFIAWLLMVVYSCFIPEIKESIFLPDSTSLYGYGDYIRIAIPAAFMTCTDWWVFEIMIFTSGLFGVYN
jgi:multidrug resistance protein, MATE family